MPLGLDSNYAHVQPDGSYHHPGLPTGLMAELDWRAADASPLIGFAADWNPVYALTAKVGTKITTMQSSWQLKPEQRPDGRALGS